MFTVSLFKIKQIVITVKGGWSAPRHDKRWHTGQQGRALLFCLQVSFPAFWPISLSQVRFPRSLPYAAAPVGDLRWAHPQPPAVPGWEGTRNGRWFRKGYISYIYIIRIQKRPSDSKHLNWSSMEPPHCFQPMYDPPFFKGSEDCLYLNVFTPMVKRGILRNKQSRLSFFFKHQWWHLFPSNRRRQNI